MGALQHIIGKHEVRYLGKGVAIYGIIIGGMLQNQGVIFLKISFKGVLNFLIFIPWSLDDQSTWVGHLPYLVSLDQETPCDLSCS